MDQPTATLLSAVAVAVVTIGGWLAVHYFTRRREIESRSASASQADRTRRLEILLKQHERQIQEFYGPIYSLIQLIWNVWMVKQAIMENLAESDNPGVVINNVKDKIDEFINENYFSPIHDEIRSIIKTRLYLLEGAEMPQSFYDYLGHSIMENVQSKLWRDAKISTRSVAGREFPDSFPTDIKVGLDSTMLSYRMILEDLNAGASTKRTATEHV